MQLTPFPIQIISSPLFLGGMYYIFAANNLQFEILQEMNRSLPESERLGHMAMSPIKAGELIAEYKRRFAGYPLLKEYNKMMLKALCLFASGIIVFVLLTLYS